MTVVQFAGNISKNLLYLMSSCVRRAWGFYFQRNFVDTVVPCAADERIGMLMVVNCF